MSDNNSQTKPEKTSHKTSCANKRVVIAAIAAIAALLIGVGIFLAVTHGDNRKNRSTDDLDMKALHTFPPIEFADSLYYKKVIASNEDETPKVVFYYEKDSTGQPTQTKVHETYLYPGNHKYIDGNIAQEERDGLWYAYYSNGTVQTMAHYVKGKENGLYAVYYDNGQVRYAGQFKMGKRIGKWNFYDKTGKLTRVQDFDTNQKQITTN